MIDPPIVSNKSDHHKHSDGYINGAPDGRVRLELDDVIETAIEKLPMAARLYPEVYAWVVTDAVLAYLKNKEETK